MIQELFNEQQEELFNLALKGCSDSDIKDYCAENNIPYKLAHDFIDEVYKFYGNRL